MSESRNVLLIEPFYSGSHKSWADALIKHSKHNISMLTLPGKHWKWRMHGAAITLAQMVNESELIPDIVVISSMMDVSTFISLTKQKLQGTVIHTYFHESQFTYPKSKDDTDISKGRDNHYAFINYTSALCSDKVFFNSKYHKNTFLNSLDEMLGWFPDHKNLNTVEDIKSKSFVVPIGLDLDKYDDHIPSTNKLRVLWNHRWEHDKNPQEFLELMLIVVKKRPDTEIVLLGQTSKLPQNLNDLIDKLDKYIIHKGYVESRKKYIELIKTCHIIPVTSHQEFFGISVAEAIYYGVKPLLPNRLSYPELIPYDAQKTHLYDKNEDLIEAILDHDIKEKKNANLIDHISQFKWEAVIKEYDDKVLC